MNASGRDGNCYGDYADEVPCGWEVEEEVGVTLREGGELMYEILPAIITGIFGLLGVILAWHLSSRVTTKKMTKTGVSSVKILETRYKHGQEFDLFEQAKKVRILGNNQGPIMRDISASISERGECFLKILRAKNIKLLISGNKQYTDLVDKVENHTNRILFNDNIQNVLNLLRNVSQGGGSILSNFHVGMHIYAHSCTMMMYDEVMYLTPYTHRVGRDSPTYVISKRELPHIFSFYENYFDRLWNDAVLATPDDDENTLIVKLNKKKEHLGLL